MEAIRKWGSASGGDVLSAVVGDSEEFSASARYTDRFADELMPTSANTPMIVDGLADDDKRVIELTQSDEEPQVSLTPEMIAAQFMMIDERRPIAVPSQQPSVIQPTQTIAPAIQTQTIPLTTAMGTVSIGTLSDKGAEDRSLVGFDKFGRKIRDFISLSRQFEKSPPNNVTDVPFY